MNNNNLDLYYTCKFNKNRCDLPFIHCSTCVDIYQWNLCCYFSWIVFNEFTQFCRVVFSYPTGLRFMLYAIVLYKIIYYHLSPYIIPPHLRKVLQVCLHQTFNVVFYKLMAQNEGGPFIWTLLDLQEEPFRPDDLV
jgi:hypothetical protein